MFGTFGKLRVTSENVIGYCGGKTHGSWLTAHSPIQQSLIGVCSAKHRTAIGTEKIKLGTKKAGDSSPAFRTPIYLSQP